MLRLLKQSDFSFQVEEGAVYLVFLVYIIFMWLLFFFAMLSKIDVIKLSKNVNTKILV